MRARPFRPSFLLGATLAAMVAGMPAAAQEPLGGEPPADRAETPAPAARPATRPPRPTRLARKAAAVSDLVPFDAAPFPYDGMIPDPAGDKPFLDHDAEGAFHLAPRAGKLRDEVYADRRSLLVVPPRFDPRRPDARLVLFFHGNLATLARDVVARQKVPQQLVLSHLNAVLVAPQMASDANDSSAGRFWNAGFLERYLAEAARHLAERSQGAFTAAAIDRLPVIVVAYSGGYLPAAFSLAHAGRSGRIEGVILLDALFGEEDKFADWIARPRQSPFFVSLYSKATSAANTALADRLLANGVVVEQSLPAHIGPGTVAFGARLGAIHNDFVTRAGVVDPLADVLRRLAGSPGAQSAPCPSDQPDCPRGQP